MADDSLMIHMAAVKFLDAKKYESHSEGFCISPVTKDELALIFCVNGEASIAEHRVLIGKQQVFLARLWQPIHVYDNAPSHTMIHIRFTCTQETAADAKAEQTGKCFFHMSKHPVVIPSTGDIYRLLAEILYERFRKNPGYQKTCTSMMQIILARLLYGSEPVGMQENRNYAEEVRAYLEMHYAEKITLPDLAQYFWVSVSHLQNQFKDRYGMTIIAWLKRYRYNKSVALITHGHVSKKEAWFKSGISGRQQYYRMKKTWDCNNVLDVNGERT